MKTRFTQFLLGATGIACCAPLSAQTDDAQALRPSAYLRVFDVPATPSQESSHRFAWDSFIAVNLPAKLGPDTVRGEPDANISILAQTGSARNMAPVVWETYRQPDEIFLQPSAWNRYPQRNDPRSAQRAGRASPASEDKVISALMKAPLDVVSGIDQPSAFIGQPLGPLLEQRGAYARYEVAVNQAYFRYIKRFQYYDAARQRSAVAACRDGTPGVIPFQRPPVGTEPYLADLPQYARIGLTEIKAAWLILDPKQDFSQRYFHRVARVVNPHGTSEKRLLGLVGLHILRFTPSGKVPATFEQIDNVVVNENASQLTPARLPLPASASFNSGKPRPSSRFGFTGVMPAPINSGSTMSDRRKLNISRVTTIAPAARKINRDYQRLLAGTVWDFYQLIGTQNPAVGDERPIGPHGTQTLNLINTTLQTYTQKGFSCMGCHAHARPKGVGIGEPDPYFKISSFLLQHAQDFKPRGE